MVHDIRRALKIRKIYGISRCSLRGLLSVVLEGIIKLLAVVTRWLILFQFTNHVRKG